MPNFKKYSYNQDAMIVINLEEQLQPGTFEFTLHHLIDDHLDLSVFYENYNFHLISSRPCWAYTKQISSRQLPPDSLSLAAVCGV